MGTLKYELTDRGNSLQKYDFFLKNIGAEKTLSQMIGEIIAEKGNARVLDIGCGEAGALKELKKIFGKKIIVCGIDALPTEGLDWFFQGDAVKKDFPDKCDLVVSFRALHEIAHLKKILKKIEACLAAGGQAILSIRMQQELGGKTFFYGNLGKKDLAFLLALEKKGVFGKLKALVLPVETKTHSGKTIIAGITVFLSGQI